MEKLIGCAGVLGLVVVICVFVRASVRQRFAEKCEEKPLLIWFLVFGMIAYVAVFMAVTDSLQSGSLMMQVAYLATPVMMCFAHGFPLFYKEKSNFLVLLVILFLWLPVETRLMLKNINIGGVRYPYVAASAMILGLVLITWKGKSELSLDWSLRKNDWKLTGKLYLLLAVVMIPVTLIFGFIKPGVNAIAQEYPYALPLVLVAFWFFPALAEEIVFRGGIQNVFSSWFGKRVGWIFASLVFGFAHINNKVKAGGQEFEQPNWHYVVFASVAGLAYGYLYQRLKNRGSRNALGMAAALHAAVDFTWWLFFKG